MDKTVCPAARRHFVGEHYNEFIGLTMKTGAATRGGERRIGEPSRPASKYQSGPMIGADEGVGQSYQLSSKSEYGPRTGELDQCFRFAPKVDSEFALNCARTR